MERDTEEKFIFILRPELNYICSNPVRASILHLLIKAKHLNHAMRVEEIARSLGKRHSVIIYHLEQLNYKRLVEVVKNFNYGSKGRRSIWGLNLKYPSLVQEVYSHTLKFFYTPDELEKMCSINKNARI
jgi:DNA-binding transcriptional ArsR family regulator